MRLISILAAAAALAATTMAVPAMADNGQGHRRDYDREHYYDHGRQDGYGHGRNDRHHRDSDRRNFRGEHPDQHRGDRYRHYDNGDPHRTTGGRCQSGQYRYQGRCHDGDETRGRYGRGVGDRLKVGDYTRIPNPGRYHLQARDGWRYYRDEHRIYRVDAESQRVLGIYGLRR